MKITTPMLMMETTAKTMSYGSGDGDADGDRKRDGSGDDDGDAADDGDGYNDDDDGNSGMRMCTNQIRCWSGIVASRGLLWPLVVFHGLPWPLY